MTLKLVMICCPDDAAPERREVRGGEFSIGRSNDNEWVVADADRHLSKKHCQFVYGAGEWQLHDLSTNGTFINGASDPIGKGASHKLRHGDRIKFGLYEIEVSLDEDSAAHEHGRFPAFERSGGAALQAHSEQSPYQSGPYQGSRLHGSEPMPGVPGSPILPPDFDPLASDPVPFAGPTEPDHAHALQSAFRPPQPVSIIPDDWDIDHPAAGQPPATPRREPAQPPFEGPVPPAASASTAPPPLATTAVPPTAAAANDADVVGALLRGLGLTDVVLGEPEKTMESLGAVVRATVSGLRQILMARASIKDEFRIEQTVIRPSGNNPLKFSLDDDDALATLLGLARGSSMPAAAAVGEAFEDLRMHELATISAMQAAVRVLLAQFDPGSIEREAGSGGLQIHPAQKKARAWDAFSQLHVKVTQALSDDFDSVFGKAFARAYEQAIEKLDSEKETS